MEDRVAVKTFQIEFITPLFSRGSYETIPEIRPASIRGQLHWWFRALGNSAEAENAVFGSVHTRPAKASPLVVRVSQVSGKSGERATLPHKTGGQASPKACYFPGTRFTLAFLERFGGLGDHRDEFYKTLEVWLLLGTLGLRGTRAAGSFQWTVAEEGSMAAPATFAQYEERCARLLAGSPLRFALLNQTYNEAELARRDVSDTIGGREDRDGENSLARIRFPLGRIRGGRKTSALRFRVVGLENRFRIAAVWDNRRQVTGNEPADLPAVIRLLADKGKPLGRQLEKSGLVNI